jgi:hypothetical protein
MIEFTIFTKDHGPLTKHISLNGDGTVKSDGSACTMSRGRARRATVADLEQFATIIEGLESNQAIALGCLRDGLPEEVGVVTKDKLNGQRDLIARTSDYIHYRAGRHAPVLLDFDRKGMPADVAARIAAAGGFWQALVEVVLELRGAAHLVRQSTSTGLSRTDTGVKLDGSGGQHAYIVAVDGADAVRFLTTLHERCWLAGYG